MDNSFTLTVSYRNEERTFEAVLEPWGYTYRINIHVNDKLVHFEPDEEGSFRAMLPFGELGRESPPVDLLQRIAEGLAEALK